MALEFNNQNASIPDPPEDTVHFRVKVNREQCQGVPTEKEAVLQALEENGIDIPLADLWASAAAHFRGAATDFIASGVEQAERQRAWDNIAHSNPRAIDTRGKGKRLLVTKADNPRTNAQIAELLAVGVGLLVSIWLYKVPLKFWSPTGLNPTDFEAYDADDNLIKLEVKGRFNRNHWADAVQGVQGKLTNSRSFDKAIGVIFAPRERLGSSAPDIEIIDPAGEYISTMKHMRLRALLSHYAPFFQRQGYTKFGDRLEELSSAPDDTFASYLGSGDSVLQDVTVQTHRTHFCYGENRFEGTAWSGTSWPASLVGMEVPNNKGEFYWALWDEVIKALKEGRLRDIAEMHIKPQTLRNKGRVLILLEDATALGWVPSGTELSPSVFEQ